MAITQSEKEELIQEVINEITTQSTSIDELPEVTNLNQTSSIPAYKKDSTELVKVPIPLISKPATDAAATANSAASSANSAAAQATQAKKEAIEAKENTIIATEAANEATARVNQAMDTINSIKKTADDANTLSKSLSSQLKNYNIESLTEKEYEELESKQDDTIYFCIEDNEL